MCQEQRNKCVRTKRKYLEGDSGQYVFYYNEFFKVKHMVRVKYGELLIRLPEITVAGNLRKQEQRRQERLMMNTDTRVTACALSQTMIHGTVTSGRGPLVDLQFKTGQQEIVWYLGFVSKQSTRSRRWGEQRMKSKWPRVYYSLMIDTWKFTVIFVLLLCQLKFFHMKKF